MSHADARKRAPGPPHAAGRNLLGRLTERSPDELRRIADCWDVPLGGRSHADNVGRLYGALRDIWAVRDRAAALTPAEEAVVEALSAAGEAARTVAELAEATGLPEGEVAAAVAALEGCGIAYPEAARPGDDAPAYFVARELATKFAQVREERLLGAALGVDAPLRALLSILEASDLEASAAVWGLRVTPGVLSREVLTDEILARVALLEQRRAVAAGLPAAGRRVFDALQEAGGALPVAALRERLGLPPAALREAGRALGERLLVWHAYVDGERTLFIPRDALAPRRAARDQPPPLTAVAAEPEDRPQYPFSAAWDLLTILQRLSQGTLAWREGDEERNATHLRRLAPALWWTADGRARPGYVPLLLTLARELGLIHTEDEEVAPTAALDTWRALAFPEQARALFDRWRAARAWPEGLSQDDLQLSGVDWPAMRQALLEELRTCRVGAWYDAAALALRSARLRPALLGGRFRAARASGPAGTREEVSAAAVRVALHGALAPLGVLLPGKTPDGAAALALSDLGGWLLGLRTEVAAPRPAGRALAVGADCEVLLLRPAPRRLWALGALAEPVRLDTVSTYRLTEASVARGVAAGLTPEQIVTFLARGNGAPLPQNVEYTLREWLRGHAGVRLTRALVLRLDAPDDAAAAERLAAALARAGLPAPEPLAGGRHLLPLPEDVTPERVLALLRDAGLTPRWARDAAGR
ncbi:MAG TPA: helicase-associated domain-containing protein [Thermomicrobiales bacterium]|nr:helicase-associated domain-containing protein [Thermomicrobiales bacterium]